MRESDLGAGIDVIHQRSHLQLTVKRETVQELSAEVAGLAFGGIDTGSKGYRREKVRMEGEEAIF